jgi:hypothetical protein
MPLDCETSQLSAPTITGTYVFFNYKSTRNLKIRCNIRTLQIHFFCAIHYVLSVVFVTDECIVLK